MEVHDLQQQLEDISKSKKESEERCMQLSRDNNDLQTQLEENDEDSAELMKKYKAAVSQVSDPACPSSLLFSRLPAKRGSDHFPRSVQTN